MSESRFDNAVQAAWGNFETRLSVSLEALGDGSMVIDVEAETSGEGSAPYIQVAGDGCLVRGEVSGDRFLDRACRLDAVQRRGLVALGWKRPDDQHPNWWVELERDRLEVLQTMVLGALRQVLGVMHPKFLGWDDPGDARQTVAAAKCEVGFPTTGEELRAMVRATVADHLGTSEVTTDADGDIPIRARKIPLWVRVLDDGATVRIFSHVVVSVLSTRQARIEADILNRRHRQLKFMVQDRRVVAAIDLPMAPFVARHLRDMLDYADTALNDVADDLVLRTSGRLFFTSRPGRPDRRTA